MKIRQLVATACAVTTAAALSCVVAAPAQAAAPAATGASSTGVPIVQPIATFAAAWAASTVDPRISPPGVNPSSCHLTKAHPRPIVLVNGTFTTMESSFGYLGPRLSNAGYCVYGYNYGGPADSPVQATGPVPAGVTALATEIRAVKKRTGAQKVDLVGYSQGGLITELYTKFGGAASVHSVTALAPTTHGTTLLGIGALAAQIPGAPAVLAQGCAACSDQLIGSPVVTALDTGRISKVGIPYTVTDTLFEDVVTPVGSSFIRESGVVNQYVQTTSPLSVDDHIDLPYDPVTADLTLAALARAGS